MNSGCQRENTGIFLRWLTPAPVSLSPLPASCPTLTGSGCQCRTLIRAPRSEVGCSAARGTACSTRTLLQLQRPFGRTTPRVGGLCGFTRPLSLGPCTHAWLPLEQLPSGPGPGSLCLRPLAPALRKEAEVTSGQNLQEGFSGDQVRAVQPSLPRNTGIRSQGLGFRTH